jgi:hypothetical protein
MTGKMNTRRTGRNAEGKTGKGVVDTVETDLEEDSLPDLEAKKRNTDEEDKEIVEAAVVSPVQNRGTTHAHILVEARDMETGKLFVVLDGFGISTDTQEPYNIYVFVTNIIGVIAAKEGAAISVAPKFGEHPKWGESPEELRASVNFKAPDNQDAHGNKVNPVGNVTPVFKNSYDKLYAAVDKMTGEFKECKDMHECNETVHWNFKLTGIKMEPMIFEGKTSLIDFTNKIKESKAASVPGVSYQP